MRLLVAAALMAALTGCGGDVDSSSPSATPTVRPVPARLVALLSGVDSGGSEGLVASRLDLPGAPATYAAQFTGSLRDRLVAAVAQTHSGLDEVYAQVVGLGCAVPTDVTVLRRHGQVVIGPVTVAATSASCEEPITTVALVVVDR